ncbi:lysophospholipase L1-like esterase [Kitasatospora sp. MAP12-15]|uniref:SGNH/GDSL hydrolase family protein n=1 Tax=unclassified Kitasatospora TaxID=2633591 RepID=UPI002476859B|nr:SGNH/GDSL hydrolase family protein [Kitasatospora sp. MAP12-44]MDH6112500.1 lysophospholipase L1-like esterase [Kitasatospora sp. MAP12-44]
MPGAQHSRARVARRIATAAAYGGGGLGLLGVGLAGVLITESRLAIRAVGILEGNPPRSDGVYGEEFADPAADHEPLVLAFLGDSTAAGLGVRRTRETPGALLAAGLASVAERRVRLVNVALSGARSDDLERQVKLALKARPEVAVIMIGANDVTRHSPAAQSVRQLGEAVRELRAIGCEVVVGTCPDLGTIKPVRPPLRWVARRVSRQLAAAQTIATVEAGGRTVSLGSLLGPEFAARPEMFASDRFHPSAQGYATAAMAMLPSLCAALDLWPEETREAAPTQREAVLPMAMAAARAAGQSGTEVASATPGGTGRWALVKHRLRLALPSTESPAEATAKAAADPAPEPTAEPASANSHTAPDDARATWE